MSDTKSDVTILGGGLAGLSLAIQCRQRLPEASITVLEKREHPVPEATFKVGESTVEVAAFYFGEMLGLKQHILDKQLPKLGLRFFFPWGDNSRIEARLELGGQRYAPCPSYQLDRGRFENFLGQECRRQGIDFVDGATIKSVDVKGPARSNRVAYQVNGSEEQLTSRWMVDASGRRALLKRKLGLQKPSRHVANAAWFRIDRRIKIDDWSDDPRWQAGHKDRTARWYSTNHLMGEGYWVWLIPLASGSTSVGIVASEESHSLSDFNSLPKAITWMERFEPQCAAEIKKDLDGVQDFLAIKRYATECRQVFSANRWAITGEAGFFHDPFYSPGSDFIAFANTFLSDLIWRDMTGRGHRIRAFTYDKIFKKFYYGTLVAYEDQYQIFGNPTVMPAKVLWDYLIYWSLTGFIFIQGQSCKQTMYLRNVGRLMRFEKLNESMQEFFRVWHRATATIELTGRVNVTEIPLIQEMNAQLLETMSNGEFVSAFGRNLERLETLACEIIDHSGVEYSVPFRRRSGAHVRANAFAPVFAASERNTSETEATAIAG